LPFFDGRAGAGVKLFGVTPPGNADGYQNKRLAGKAIRKVMKIKGIKIDFGWRTRGGIRKVMKTKAPRLGGQVRNSIVAEEQKHREGL
jgi:hypothetical protein